MSQQINLLTSAFRQAPHRAATLLLYAVVFVIVGAAAGAAYEQHRLQQARNEAEAVGRELKQVEARHAELAKAEEPRGPAAAREAELANLLAQIKRRKDVIDAIKGGAAGTSAGFSEFMRAFARRSVDGVWLTGFDIDAGGREMTLSGRAVSADLVPRYVEGLNRESLMQGRQFAALRVEQVVVQRPAPASAPVAPLEKPPAQSPAPSDKPAAAENAGSRSAQPAPDEPKAAKAEKPKPSVIRYVEFSMSTPNAGQAAAAPAASAPAGILSLVPGIGVERPATPNPAAPGSAK